MEVLVALACHPGEVVIRREHLLDEVWRERVVSDKTLIQCVYQFFLQRRHAIERQGLASSVGTIKAHSNC